jgi:predicted RNA-binding Zn ribbon-like protein
MAEAVTRASSLKLLGGRLSLDFANTGYCHASEDPVELLTSYSELVDWSVHAGILTGHEGQRLLEEANRRRVEAAAVLERAITLREAIYQIFSALSREQAPRAADLAVLNAELPRTLARSRIVPTLEGFAWDWATAEDTLDGMLSPVVRDAADLLTSGELDRVGQCADGRCGWLFLDTSRTRSRRWCSMEDCGNRAKARRHYERSRHVQSSGHSRHKGEA